MGLIKAQSPSLSKDGVFIAVLTKDSVRLGICRLCACFSLAIKMIIQGICDDTADLHLTNIPKLGVVTIEKTVSII